MALKTNSKAAKANLYFYIRQHVIHLIEAGENATMKDIYSFIWERFTIEKSYAFKPEYIKAYKVNYQDIFEEWAQGLPLDGLFTYYLHNAVNTLAIILEESENERSRYTETQAEKLLTSLIYREVIANK